MELLENELILAALTFAIYWGAKELQDKTGSILLNPLLITIIAVIAFLKIAGIDYETYHQSGQYIEFWLKPAIVALGYPLYHQLHTVRKQLTPILVSQFVGCIVGIVSAVFIARWCGASDAVAISLAPKSVTTPIAVEVSRTIGGIPSLSAAIVILTGLLGAIIGFRILGWIKILDPTTQGLGMGTASHAMGTVQANEHGATCGAFASIGMILNGIFTAMLAPSVLALLGLL